jgi:hypothetical protein
MDEDELRVILLERASRGTARGADAVVEAVELSLPKPRPARRTHRMTFAVVLLAAAVASVVVIATRGSDRVRTGHGVAPAGSVQYGPDSPLYGTVPNVASTAPVRSTPAPSEVETIGSVHPINPSVAWVVTSQHVVVTDDRGAHWQSVFDDNVAAGAFVSPTDGVVVQVAASKIRAVPIRGRKIAYDLVVEWPLSSLHTTRPDVHITRTPDQYVMWVNDDCHGTSAPPCGTHIFSSPDGGAWTQQWAGAARDGIRCAKLGSCWAFAYREDGSPVLMHSSDTGSTWAATHDPIPTSEGRAVSAEILGALDNVFTYEVDDYADQGAVTPLFVVSVDSGKTFSTHTWPPLAGAPGPDDPYLGVVRHANGTWTALFNDTVLEASSDSLHWRVVDAHLPFFVTTSKWSDSRTGWIAGTVTPHLGDAQVATKLAYTLDAGHSWHVVAPPLSNG